MAMFYSPKIIGGIVRLLANVDSVTISF